MNWYRRLYTIYNSMTFPFRTLCDLSSGLDWWSGLVVYSPLSSAPPLRLLREASWDKHFLQKYIPLPKAIRIITFRGPAHRGSGMVGLNFPHSTQQMIISSRHWEISSLRSSRSWISSTWNFSSDHVSWWIYSPAVVSWPHDHTASNAGDRAASTENF